MHLFQIKKITYILFLFLVVLSSKGVYPELSNTDEILTKPSFIEIDKLIEKEKNESKEIKTVEELIKKANNLIELIDYLKGGKDKKFIGEIITTVEELYKEGLQKYPTNLRIYDDYGSFLYDYKMDYINSVKLWEQGYALNENDPSINNNLALHYFHVGDYDKGWKHLQNALKYGEKEANILYNSAQIFIIYRNQIQERTGWEKEKIYKKAMEYSEKAVKINPNDFELSKDYALNFFTATQFNLPIDGKKSANAWQNARKKARTEDEIFYTWVNEGRAWLAINELKKARECLVEAIKIRPDSKIVKEILSRIDSGEIKESIKEQKKTQRVTEEEYRNPLISPFKNYSGRKNTKTILPQVNRENIKK